MFLRLDEVEQLDKGWMRIVVKLWWRRIEITWQLSPELFQEHRALVLDVKTIELGSPSLHSIKVSIVFRSFLFLLWLQTCALSSTAVATNLRICTIYCISWWTNCNSQITAVDGNTHNLAFLLPIFFENSVKIGMHLGINSNIDDIIELVRNEYSIPYLRWYQWCQ